MQLDIGRILVERQYSESQLQLDKPDPSILEKFRLFIAFRMLLYCDVCHDFLGDRTKKAQWDQQSKIIFYEKQRQLMYDDITWYQGKLSLDLHPGSEKLAFVTMFKSRKLISWARKSMMKRDTKVIPPDFITSDDIAKKVCYPRIKNTINGVAELPDITNIKSNLKYFMLYI